MNLPVFEIEGFELPDKYNEVTPLKKRNGNPASIAQMVRHTRKQWGDCKDFWKVEYPARIYRKLMFLEYFFGRDNWTISPMEVVSGQVVGSLDMLIRGILYGTIQQEVENVTKRLTPPYAENYQHIISHEGQMVICDLPVRTSPTCGITLRLWIPNLLIYGQVHTRKAIHEVETGQSTEDIWIRLVHSVKKLRIDFPYAPEDLRANRRKMNQFIDRLAQDEPRDLALQVLQPIYQECGSSGAGETAMAYVRAFRPLAPRESLTCWRHDLSDDGKTWVIQLAVILESKQDAQLYLVFVDRRTGLIQTNLDAKNLPAGQILRSEKGGDEWGLPLFGES
jgi:hypothetical protein